MRRRTRAFLFLLVFVFSFIAVPVSAESVNSWDGITNYLILGTDVNSAPEQGRRGNADGIIIISINENTKKVTVLSVLRDTLLHQVDYPPSRATLICHDYGLAAIVDAIENDLHIPVDFYAIFNYMSVAAIIDYFGGVEMELSTAEISMMNAKIRGLNEDYFYCDASDGFLDPSKPGCYLLTGKQAAVYMRCRISDETNNDFGRTARIRAVLFALKDKASSLSALSAFSLVTKVIPSIESDISFSQAASLIINAPSYMSYDFVSDYIPHEGMYNSIDSTKYLDYDMVLPYVEELLACNS